MLFVRITYFCILCSEKKMLTNHSAAFWSAVLLDSWYDCWWSFVVEEGRRMETMAMSESGFCVYHTVS